VAFLGLAKNVGKTTALVAALEALHALECDVGITSAGRDGEALDAITGEPKPRVTLRPGQLAASAASTFDAASFRSTLLAELPFRTRFGAIAIRRAEETGDIELIGPSTASEARATADALAEAGARLVLLDGAIGRRAFAAARVSDGIVLCVGLAAGSSLPAVIEAARSSVELIRLGPPPGEEAAGVVEVAGALTDELLAELSPPRGSVLLVEDFAAVFLSPEARRRLARDGVTLAVRSSARLLAVAANPTGPGRAPLDAATLLATLRPALPGLLLVDVVAGLVSEP
jgi:hypothetical protein